MAVWLEIFASKYEYIHTGQSIYHHHRTASIQENLRYSLVSQLIPYFWLDSIMQFCSMHIHKVFRLRNDERKEYTYCNGMFKLKECLSGTRTHNFLTHSRALTRSLAHTHWIWIQQKAARTEFSLNYNFRQTKFCIFRKNVFCWLIFCCAGSFCWSSNLVVLSNKIMWYIEPFVFK